MFFQRKGQLRKQFDEKLLLTMEQLKKEWQNNNTMIERSFDPSEEVKIAQKISEAKYFFLFHEVKKRQIVARK